MKQQTAKTLRILTIAPIMATVLCILLKTQSEVFLSLTNFIAALVFLGLFPILAYPFAWIIPPLRKKGRDVERRLAVLFAVLGYLGGTIFSFATSGGNKEQSLYLTYLISALLTALLNFCFHFKSSGHSCGVSGPVAMLAYRISPWYLFAYLLLIPVFVSSRTLKRHSYLQLIAGTLVPVVSMFISFAIVSAF